MSYIAPLKVIEMSTQLVPCLRFSITVIFMVSTLTTLRLGDSPLVFVR